MAHGKGARERTRQRRLSQKRARKAAQQALYESRRDEGRNKKSKRFMRSNKGANGASIARIIIMLTRIVKGKELLVARKAHGGPFCGNIGCRKCFDRGRRIV